jgi:hypothetical protein
VTRPTAPPEPFEESAWWGSSGALDILTELDAVARVSGRAVEVVVTPFTPPPALKRNAAGRPIVLLPGDTFRVTSRRELDAVALEALRRRLASPGGDGEVFDEAQEQAERWQAAQELRP